MKRFLITILLFVGIPQILLVGIYVWTDPFRCLHAFDINDVDATNRDYLSTELFLRNDPMYHYNSFIFASSRGGGMNTYQWKQYLPDGAQPFLFQAWSESLTGIEMKINYLNEHNIPIDNALILFDIPGSFVDRQVLSDALSMKHYTYMGKSKFEYNAKQFYNFIQKPSLWISNIKNTIRGVRIPYQSDTITNDYYASNRDNFDTIPQQDSLQNCSEIVRTSFISKVEHNKSNSQSISDPQITECFKKQLEHIKRIFDENKTDYYIILTPGCCYTEPSINPKDLSILQEIFGENRVYNYTGKNAYTEDYNNFSDPGHFGLRVGYQIIEDIYVNKE